MLQIILGILVIILFIIIIVKFFQIATDVRVIKEHLKNNASLSCTTIDVVEGFTIGSTIVEKKTEKQMRIIGIDEKIGKFVCSNTNGITSVNLSADEIILFEDYVKMLKKK